MHPLSRKELRTARARVSVRTYYNPLIELIRLHGGQGVQEVQYNSDPDIIFELLGETWLLPVKIGQTPNVLKSAFLQYQRHKEERELRHGVLLFLPEEARRVPAGAPALAAGLPTMKVTCLVDTPIVKEEWRDATFPEILRRLAEEVGPRLRRAAPQAFPLRVVLGLMRQQLEEVMATIAVSGRAMLGIITDRKLLSDLGHLTARESDAALRFLSAYILLSQILFLRLLASARPDLMPGRPDRATPRQLRVVFQRIREIHYKPIYEIDVLDAVPENSLRDTFDLIWGLEVERIRYELPGRLFHDLMPPLIRKTLAAFYTRPQAAELLSHLAIGGARDTVLDPACGSGTILTSVYLRKRRLWNEEGRRGGPHKRFCEEEIFGADIMPFAVHLASANLAAMESGTTIDRTQLIEGDSLGLVPGERRRSGLRGELFPPARKAKKSSGEEYEVDLERVDVVVMNPPFTKVERGIRRYVDMEKFGDVVGHEVGLWAHFLLLANEFLGEGGVCGAVIPINLLRGRESSLVRDFVFSEWTPLVVLKPTLNYGFSEWAEYRDVILVARKGRPPRGHAVRFAFVKQDLNRLNEPADVSSLAERIRRSDRLRSPDLDVESFPAEELRARRKNLMWFCGGCDYRHRDVRVDFVRRFAGRLGEFPGGYFREGYRPVPEGVSSFMFLTRNSGPERAREAFLVFDDDTGDSISVTTPAGQAGATYAVERAALRRSLRTNVGLRTMDITGREDYVARQPYREWERVKRAAGFQADAGLDWRKYWRKVSDELDQVVTNLVVVHRINPFSPTNHLASFFSANRFSPSNQPLVVREADARRAKAVCALLNSAAFFANFFLLKEESTGRYINVRAYDLHEMALYPPDDAVAPLARVFDRFARREFPSLREQFDRHFDTRYQAYREQLGRGQGGGIGGPPAEPAAIRADFDRAVCEALGVEVSEGDLVALYGTFAEEMVVTRSLQKD